MNFVNSEFTREQVLKNVDSKRSQFQVTNKGIEIEDFHYQYKQINKEVNFLFVGSDFHRKGLDIALKTIYKLKESDSNYSFFLRVVGENSELESTFIPIIEEYNLENNVEFLGRRSKNEIKQYHNDSHFSLLPSREEAFGVSVIEALASGTTAICSNTGGIPSIIEHNEDGILVEVEDTLGLVEAILGLIRNEKKRESITKNGLLKAEKFDFDNIYQDILNEINNV
ncbi:glycosyltransferase [Salibacterium salarium]|uniref:Glycosyltransferase n=2 Tax=Salibacterium salarium TaxID=284579 RepID=A0A428MUH1_9BACI|nr:glycosyltransferase [Salibacterium salarium]